MGSLRELLMAALADGALVLCAAFFGYILIIVVPYLRRKPSGPGDFRDFHWHFLIPCLNEEQVIEQTVQRLLTNFPWCHVWCIDDGSTDNTGPLLAAIAARCKRVHVVNRRPPHARKGKGPALNAGWQALTAARPPEVDPAQVIVGVIDGDGHLDVRCPSLVAGPTFFGDPAVGAVQIQVRVANALPDSGTGSRSRDPLIVRLQDVEFRSVIGAIQTFRKHVGSAGMGGNGQFTRLSVLDRIAAEHGTPWKESLIEDFELGVHVLLSGSRTEYCHETFVVQQGPPSFRRLVRQRSRWGQGLMQCIRYLPAILRSPTIGNSAAMELTYCLLLPWGQLVGGIAMIAMISIFTAAALAAPAGPLAWMHTVGWGLFPLFLVFALLPLTVWGPVHRVTAAPDLSWPRAFALGLANWPYSYIHHIAIWWAFGRTLGSRRDWKKTEREPEPVVTSYPEAPSRMVPAPTGAALTPRSGTACQSARPARAATHMTTANDWEQAVVYQTLPRPRSSARVGHHSRARSGAGSKRSAPTSNSPSLVSAGVTRTIPYSYKREER